MILNTLKQGSFFRRPPRGGPGRSRHGQEEEGTFGGGPDGAGRRPRHGQQEKEKRKANAISLPGAGVIDDHFR